MRFHFNERKTAQAAAYLLKLHGGPLSYMVLIKLLYLADRAMLLKHGQPITGDKMFAMQHGPVLSRVLDLISDGPDERPTAWFEYVSAPSNYEVTLAAEAPTDELSRFEVTLLAGIHKQFGHMDRWQLVRFLHETLPEWKDPGSSSTCIEPEEILRAEGVPEVEIDRVQRSAKEAWFFESIANL